MSDCWSCSPRWPCPHVRLENLTYVNLPWSPGGSFSPILLGALIGVVLDIYAAHILVAIFGKMLLQRDPSGRSVVRGHAAGIGFAMLLNIVWVLAVCGAVAPEVLASQSSTVLVPLAAEVGPQVRVLGAIFVILSMGLGLIQFSLALFSLARERIGQRFSWGGSRGRFLLSLVPVILVLLVAEWMVLTDTGSFAGILGFLGVMVHSLMSGIFPMLLLAASRRKGELVPGVSYRALGHPLVIGGVYLAVPVQPVPPRPADLGAPAAARRGRADGPADAGGDGRDDPARRLRAACRG